MRRASIKFASKKGPIEGRLSKKFINGQITIEQLLKQIGMAMENEISDSIVNGGWIPNSPRTEKRKGFNKPLIETSQMFQTITSKVS
jgi:hypothetical protein